MDPNDHAVKPLAQLLEPTFGAAATSLILQFYEVSPVSVVGGYGFAVVMSNGQVQMRGGAKIDDVKTHLEEPARAGVRKVYATEKAFAAHMGNSSVVAWGFRKYGGVVNDLDEHVINKVVTTMASTERAFAAILQDGTLMAWGDAKYGGKSPPVTAADEEYDMIVPNRAAFAAKTESGVVVAWGNVGCGGLIDEASRKLLSDKKRLGCLNLVATDWGFAAVMGDYSLVVWGDAGHLPSDQVRRILAQPNSALNVWANRSGFLAQGRNGNTTFVGCPGVTDEKLNVLNKLLSSSGIVSVTTTWDHFAALMQDSTVVMWDDCGDYSRKYFETGVEEMFATEKTIAVLTRDKQLFLWGQATSKNGNNTGTSPDQRVHRVHVSREAIFADIVDQKRKRLLVWGDQVMARSIPKELQTRIQLRGLKSVVSCTGGCAAMLLDGSVIGWFFNACSYTEIIEL